MLMFVFFPNLLQANCVFLKAVVPGDFVTGWLRFRSPTNRDYFMLLLLIQKQRIFYVIVLAVFKLVGHIFRR